MSEAKEMKLSLEREEEDPKAIKAERVGTGRKDPKVKRRREGRKRQRRVRERDRRSVERREGEVEGSGETVRMNGRRAAVEREEGATRGKKAADLPCKLAFNPVALKRCKLGVFCSCDHKYGHSCPRWFRRSAGAPFVKTMWLPCPPSAQAWTQRWIGKR